MEETLQRVKEKLAFLQQSDFNEPFCLEGRYHELVELWGCEVEFERRCYDLGPCRSEPEVQNFEQRHNIRLPEEYRRFLLEVGNGGAGPLQQLLPLEETIKEGPWRIKRPPDPPVYPLQIFPPPPRYSQTRETLEQPFPLTGRLLAYDRLRVELDRPTADWRLLHHILVESELPAIEQWCAAYYDDLSLGHGLLAVSTLSDYPIYYLLIVTGSERGNIWTDHHERAGIYPVPHPVIKPMRKLRPLDLIDDEVMDTIWQNPLAEHSRCDFLTWYEGWLDDELKALTAEKASL